MIFELHGVTLAQGPALRQVCGLWRGASCDKTRGMFGRKSRKPKPRERFYLLPGQGGQNFHRKQRLLLSWAVAVALLGGALLTAAMWWLSRPKV
jgi:hypothetical protein